MEQEFSFPLEIPSIDDYGETNVMFLKNYYLDTFKKILYSISPQKIYKIFCDSETLDLLNYITSNFHIENMKIEKNNLNDDISTKIYKFKQNEIPIFIIKPKTELIDIAVTFFYKYKKEINNTSLDIIFIPGENYEIKQHLRRYSSREIFNIKNFYIDLIPLDFDLITLSKNESLKELYLENNNSILNYFADAIVKLETCYGKIKSYYLIGEKSKILKNLIEKSEEEDDFNYNEIGEIYSSIIIDRQIDFITPLCTNYTFEGALDEYINIIYNQINYKEIIDNDEEKKKEKNNKNKINDINFITINEGFLLKIYPEIRCMHLINANIYIDYKIKDYYNIYQKGKNNPTDLKKVSEVMTGLKKLINEKDSANICFNIANFIDKQRKDFKIQSFIQKEQLLIAGNLPKDLHDIYNTFISKKKDLYELLRLMILENFSQDGILNYKEIKRDIINVFGFEKIFLLNNLEKIKWLKEKKSSYFSNTIGSFNNIIEKFHLINENFNFNNIKDCSYTLGGFCPFILKIIENFIKEGLKNYFEIFKSLNIYFDFPQNENELLSNKKEKNFVFLFFIGGVTYTEISGIRFLNRINKDLKFIIVTTNILNQKKTILQFDHNINQNYSIKKFYQDYEKENKKKK